MSHRRALAASAAVSLLLLGACAPRTPTDAPQSAGASSSASHSPAASASASEAPETTPEPGLDATKPINADNWMSSVEGLPPVRSDDPAKALALTGIRAAAHEGFTRVVLEFSGEGTPGVRGDLDIVSDGTFEDNTHVVIGAPAAREFQIGFLSNPVRMVIDIRD